LEQKGSFIMTKISPNLKAIIFDFDGVLIDTERVQLLAWAEVAHRRGINPCEIGLDDTPGMSDEHIGRLLIRGNQESVDSLIAEKERLTHAFFERDGVKPVAGALDFVCWAQGKYRLAVASNSSVTYLERMLPIIGMSSAFDAVVSAEEYLPKPEPAVYLLAVEALGVAANRCVAIEDSPVGLEAAKRAGLLSIGLVGTFKAEALRTVAAVVVDSFVELRAYLNSLVG